MAEEFSTEVVKRFTGEIASRLIQGLGSREHGANAQFARPDGARVRHLARY